MADDYIERKFEEYQARKAAWERKRRLGLDKKKAAPTPPATETQESVVHEYDDRELPAVDDTLLQEDD